MLSKQRKQAWPRVTLSWDCFIYRQHVAFLPPVVLWGKKTFKESTNVKSSQGANEMVGSVAFCT